MPDSSSEASIFAAALQITDASARVAYVADVCGADEALRRQVERLLSAYGEGEFLESPMAGVAATALFTPAKDLPGKSIGPYKILEQIGEGGMGLVFMGEQTHPLRRRVAIKIIKPGLDSQAVIARFEVERQALAMMDHPNIARIFDAGTTDEGRPYFVMELVRGVPITTYCHDRSLSLRDRLLLFIDVCHAVQHAHQKGIIHRDIKPTNLLVSQSDTGPVPKVIDFGVAKATIQPLTDKTLFTHFSQIIGTPLYMSPEQADLGNQDIDTRSDVYSLGVVLYELLTGTTPFNSERLRSLSHDEMRRIIREEEPPKPSTRNTAAAQSDSTLREGISPLSGTFRSALKGDLDWIVMKTLEKDRRRRYESPSALVADLQRYLERQPVLARPPSYFDKWTKWSRRHVAAIWSALAISLFVALASVVSALLIADSRDEANQQRDAATNERDRAVVERERARRNAYFAEIVASQIEVEQRNIAGPRAKLEGHLPLPSYQDHRGWEWYYLLSMCHPEQGTLRDFGNVFATWSPDDKLIGGSGAIWDAVSGTRHTIISTSRILRSRTSWSPDGQYLAWGMCADDNGIYLWNRSTNDVQRLGQHDNSVWCLDWNPDGTKLASGSIDHTVKIWDVALRTVIRTVSTQGDVYKVAWHPRGETLAAAINSEKGIMLLNPETGSVIAEPPRGEWDRTLDWSPNGDQLFVANGSRWQVLSKGNLDVEREHPLSRSGRDIACSPDGTKVAITHGEATTIWDLKADMPVATLPGHLNSVTTVAWNSDGRRLITSSEDGEVKIWNVDDAMAQPAGPILAEVKSVNWSNDGATLLLTGESESQAIDWSKGDTDPVRRALPQFPGTICSSANGSVVAIDRTADSQPNVQIMDAASREPVAVLRVPDQNDLRPDSCALSDDGSRFAMVSRSPSSVVLTNWDIHQERVISKWEWSFGYPDIPGDFTGKATWSPDGTMVSIVTLGDKGDNGRTYWGHHLNVIDVVTGHRIHKHCYPETLFPKIQALIWNNFSSQIAIGTLDGQVEVVVPATNRVQFSKKLSAEAIHSLAWHPEGMRLASSSQDGKARVIDASTGQSLLTFALPDVGGAYLAWSVDGRRLAAVSTAGQVRTWDATGGYEIAAGGTRRGELAWAYYDRVSTVDEAPLALREALSHAPDTRDFWSLRGQIYATLGDYDRAAEEYSKLIGSEFHRNVVPALDLARCYMAGGMEAEYQRVCASLISVFKDDEIPSNRWNALARCVVSPKSTSSADQETLLSIAAGLREAFGADRSIGACFLRQGRLDEAVQTLSANIAGMPLGPDEAGHGELALSKYLLALARHQMGHVDQARRLLNEANKHAAQSGDLRWNWRLRVDIETLRQEVEAALAP